MLHWRLLVGIPLVCLLIGLCWLDACSPAPGIFLMPFYLICVFFLCKELLQLLHAGGIYPRRTTVYLGVFGTIVLCWFSCYNSLPLIARFEGVVYEAIQEQTGVNFERGAEASNADADAESSKSADPNNATDIKQAASALESAKLALEKAQRSLDAARERSQNRSKAKVETSGGQDAEVDLLGVSNEQEWKTAAFAGVHILLAIAAGILIAFVGEMLRFKQPGGNIINLTGAIFAIVYIGLLGSFMVVLRIAYGIMAVVSMIVVTKLCDVGAYTVGRLIGKHKMAPSLSPGKTIEGGLGGMFFAVFGAWLSTSVLFPLASGRPSQTTLVGMIVYGIAVGVAGAIGDLAESLIKRDVMRKDSGTHVPGFGGFLDIFDSLLIASPVAFALWAFHVVR